MIHVIGAGSLGLLWAARLARAGNSCRVVLRNSEALDTWQARKQVVRLTDGSHQSDIQIPAELPSSSDPIKTLIVATKAYSAEEAVASIAHRLNNNSRILLLQNGMGSQQAVRRRYPEQSVLYASVTEGAWTPGPGQVVWAGRGTNRIGDPAGGGAPDWLRGLDEAGITWQWTLDIERTLWQKLAINCAINPLTVLHDCPNGDIRRHAASRLDLLIRELHELLSRYDASADPETLRRTILQVIANTAANTSSMRQDMQAGRRTEIDFILGYAVRQARSASLQLSTLEGLYADLSDRLISLGLPAD